MNALVRAELVKLRTVRVLWIALAAAIGLTAVTLALHLVNAGRAGTPSLGTAGSAVSILGAPGWSAFVGLVLGIVAVTGDFRHGTIVPSFLVTPRRRDVIIAKAIAASLAALVLALCALAVSVAVGVATGALAVAGGNVQVVATAGGVLLTIPLYAMLGVGFGTLVTNQTVAVPAALLWFLVGETMLGSFGLRALQPWTPGGATAAISLSPTLQGALPPWAGVLLLVAYAVALGAIGTWRITRRDLA